MTEQEEPKPDPIRAAVDAALDKVPEGFADTLSKVASAEPDTEEPDIPESVGKSDTSTGSEPEGGVQGGADEPPSGEPAQEAIEASMSELRRHGLTPDAFKGKSEGALIVAMGEALMTARREQDRRLQELREAQGDSTPPADPDQGDEAENRDSGRAQATPPETRPSVDLEAVSSVLADEMDEEAAQPILAAFTALAEQNAQLVQRFEAQEQERQAAPVNRAIDEELAGDESLSNPDKREAFLAMAQAKASLDGLEVKPGETPDAFARRVIRNALPKSEEEAPPSKRRVTEKAPEVGRGRVPARKPRTLREVIQEAGDKAFNH